MSGRSVRLDSHRHHHPPRPDRVMRPGQTRLARPSPWQPARAPVPNSGQAPEVVSCRGNWILSLSCSSSFPRYRLKRKIQRFKDPRPHPGSEPACPMVAHWPQQLHSGCLALQLALHSCRQTGTPLPPVGSPQVSNHICHTTPVGCRGPSPNNSLLKININPLLKGPTKNQHLIKLEKLSSVATVAPGSPTEPHSSWVCPSPAQQRQQSWPRGAFRRPICWSVCQVHP